MNEPLICPYCKNDDERLMQEVIRNDNGVRLMECVSCSKMFRVGPDGKPLTPEGRRERM